MFKRKKKEKIKKKRLTEYCCKDKGSESGKLVHDYWDLFNLLVPDVHEKVRHT